MALEGVARSDEAVALTRSVSLCVFNRANKGKRGRPSSAHDRAVAALICDLLWNAEEDRAQWGYRSHRAIEFTGRAVGRRVYIAAFEGLLREGMLEFVPGHQQHMQFGGAKVPSWRKAPRLRATAQGLERAVAAGITPTNWREHFDIVPARAVRSRKPPLECRTPSRRVGGVKHRGGALPIDLSDPEVLELHDQVTRINTFLAQHDIVGEDHSGFQRIFNAPVGDKCVWNKGGRLSSVERKNYQVAKKPSRAKMTIDGHPVVELDLTASHLTILHALRDYPFDPSDDPYFVEGIPRDVVKRWVTMTLGHRKLHRSWPKSVRADLDQAVGGSLQAAYPIGKTSQAILNGLPLLGDWGESPIDWGDLQYVESKVMVKTVETLAFTHGVPCLPVHDSIIVAAHHQELASQVLKEAFRSVVGVNPHLKVA